MTAWQGRSTEGCWEGEGIIQQGGDIDCARACHGTSCMSRMLGHCGVNAMNGLRACSSQVLARECD